MQRTALTTTLPLAAICFVSYPISSVDAAVIGGDDFDGGGNYQQRIISPQPAGGTFPGSALDVFGIVDRTVNTDFEDDTQAQQNGGSSGLVPSVKADRFFGVADLKNGDNTSGEGFVTWTFATAGYQDLSLSVDLAAMGDFESGDQFHFLAFFSGSGAPVAALAVTVDESATQNYVFEDGTGTFLNDPLSVNGTALDNSFQTFSAPIAGTGTELLLAFQATQDAGGELFAMDNVVVEGTLAAVPIPATAVLLGSALMLLSIQRRGPPGPDATAIPGA